MNYITKHGFQKLSDELNYLWKDKRPKVTQAVSEAAALGDRSENAEYIYGKKMLREIDRRVRFLSKRLDELTIVDALPANQDKIFFGAYITLEDEAGKERLVRIVGSDEFDNDPCYISINSPLARALIGKTFDDEILLKLETGPVRYLVVDIEYKPL
ncbi:MAG: transcription elongation factor GreB [Xanthomonadaceae bacterium]|nr:transcription elongation factor GreB [Xanthomonadaceae bacterium]